ncbi:MAG: ABC transporter ATP-binding protein/permease [Firmicutes bacterium]|nr:ABC transporter ATP-binding protein/permease [Bacillota bacterium]
MLRLQNIVKNYQVADTTVKALRGVSLSFRENEFVSILGPSGCGKTTLLNIIGGLDKYTSGDMFISGISTKLYKSKDWDVYRNRRIGFIFQSYNLIPHQTVLGNVELALTIAGLSKSERVAKAKLALDKVGLSDQYYKRPNQLSGGQSQRVAIARALVNDPDILLADEPTGALDTETSVQIMQLIKEIAKEKLVLMVTHNPELAEEYSTRIIKLLDGQLTSDSDPYSAEEEIEVTNEANLNKPAEAKKSKAKMSFWTAFKLSLRNLFTKKARTIMTSFAGSIGIIGVSLVLSISYGVQAYISNMQSDMLSGNPITISQTDFDYASMMGGMNMQERAKLDKKPGLLNVQSMIQSMVERAKSFENLMIENTITKDYLRYLENMPESYAPALHYDYGLDISNNIYTDFREMANGEPQVMSLSMIKALLASILGETEYADYSSFIAGIGSPFSQTLSDKAYILNQHKAPLYGRYPETANEIMVVVNKDREITDLTLAQMGFYSQEEFANLIYKAVGDETHFNEALFNNRIEISDIVGKSFYWYSNNSVFKNFRFPGMLELMNNPDAIEDIDLDEIAFSVDYLSVRDNDFPNIGTFGALELKVVGVIEAKDSLEFGTLSRGFYYTEALTQHILARAEAEKKVMGSFMWWVNYLTVIMDMPNPIIPSYMTSRDSAVGITYNYSYSFHGVKKVVGGKDVWTYTFGCREQNDCDLDTQTCVCVKNRIGLVGQGNMMTALLGQFMPGFAGREIFTISLQQLGGIDIPTHISIYPKSFSQKTSVLQYLDNWNSNNDIEVNGKILTAEDREDIKYSDLLSIIIGMINTFIRIITVALVGFTALSLVVSCVMIAIITYVSVVERIKEIGVIRSLGGRKKDVAYLFNAETFIIGAVAGLIGIGVTYLVSFILNIALMSAFDGMPKIAIFPWFYAVIMTSVSIGLTLLSGLFPSYSASKKDPVVALRTE